MDSQKFVIEIGKEYDVCYRSIQVNDQEINEARQPERVTEPDLLRLHR